MNVPNDNAARWGQPGSGANQSDLTPDHYHEVQEPATTAMDVFPDKTTSIAPNEGSSTVASPLAFLHAGDPRATTALQARASAAVLESQLAMSRMLIDSVLHAGIEAGGLDEAKRRCELLADELSVSARAISRMIAVREDEHWLTADLLIGEVRS